MTAAPLFEHASRSIKGRRRSINQDRYVVDAELGFILLADGVAGRPAGERAAEVAITAASTQLALGLRAGGADVSIAPALVGDAFRLANLAVHRVGALDDASANMASTLVGAVFLAEHAIIGNLGDSRVYRLRDAFLKQVTLDHLARGAELAQLSQADAAAVRPLVQVLSRAVGHRGEPEPDVSVEALCDNDVFLFCSNGLYDAVDRVRMAELLSLCDSLDEACDRLVRAAEAAGAVDDVTFVVARPNFTNSMATP